MCLSHLKWSWPNVSVQRQCLALFSQFNTTTDITSIALRMYSFDVHFKLDIFPFMLATQIFIIHHLKCCVRAQNNCTVTAGCGILYNIFQLVRYHKTVKALRSLDLCVLLMFCLWSLLVHSMYLYMRSVFVCLSQRCNETQRILFRNAWQKAK